MHLALAEVEVDVVVRDDAREPLRDAAKLENGPLVHPRAILWRRQGGPQALALALADGFRDVLDLARGDLILDAVHLRDEVGRHVGGDLAEPDAARGDVEDRVRRRP